MPQRELVEKRVLGELARLSGKREEGPGYPSLAAAGRLWHLVRGSLLEAAAEHLDRGEMPPEAADSPRQEEQLLCIEVLDGLTEVHRLAACHRWLDRLQHREIAAALRDRYSVTVSPPEVKEILHEVRGRIASARGELVLRASPGGKIGCGTHSSALESLIEGESLLNRQKRRVLDHLSTCLLCARTLESFRGRDSWTRGVLNQVAAAHPDLSALEEYRVEIAPSPTRRHLLERHLDRCNRCRTLLEVLQSLSDLDPETLLKRASVRRRVRAVATWSAAAAVLLGAIGVVSLWRGWQTESRAAVYRSLGLAEERLEYEPGRWPDRDLPRDEDPLWRSAILAYEQERCGEAAGHFADYVSVAQSDPVGRLFLGASLLCDDRPAEAVKALDGIAAAGGVWEEGTWLLAHAHLAQGELGEARAALSEIYLHGKIHVREAEQKLELLR